MNAELNAIARALERLVASEQKGALEYVNIGVILTSLCVLIWYTMETYRLRKAGESHTAETTKLLSEAQRQNDVSTRLLEEAQRQNEVSVMPIVAIAVEASGGDAGRIVLINVGLGPAFNLTIDRLACDSRTLQVEHGSGVLRPGQEQELRFHVIEREGGSLLNAKTLWLWIKAQRIPPFDVVVRCKSVSSRAYVFRFSVTSQAEKLQVTYEGIESL